MRFFKSIVLAVVSISLAVCQGCGGNSFAPHLVTEQRPEVLTETPLASSAFVDSIGVNLHMTYGGTPYDTDYAKWAPMLRASGIKHVRDAFCSFSLSFCRNVVSARMNELAAVGVRFDLLTSLKDTAAFDATYSHTMGLHGVEAVEGPNECDTGAYCPSGWRNVLSSWQKTIYGFGSPDITVIGPSMVTQSGYSSFGNLSAFMDVGNVHDYVGPEPPEAQDGLPDHLQWVTPMSGSKPVWVTETGYSTDSKNVPEAIQARYISRALFENLRSGVPRTYIYQLFDYGPDDGARMGLLNADYTPKPAWTRVEQLLGFFNDNGASPRMPLRYAIRNDDLHALHHVLFQRSDGTYLLVLWLATTDYNARTHSVSSPREEVVDVALPAGAGAATLTQFPDGATPQNVTVSVSNGTASVRVSSLVSVLSFNV